MNAVSLSDLLGQVSIGFDAVEADLAGAVPYHSKRVAVLCLAIGKRLSYDEQRLFTLAGCALLHDNALTQYILSENPNPQRGLNLRGHCVLGEENCKCIPFPFPSEGFIKYHHEHADGSGVFGLKEGEYPQEAGIIALADQVDVRFGLRQAGGDRLEQVKAYIKAGGGIKFSHKIADLAVEVLDEELLGKMRDENIHRTLRDELPEVIQELGNDQIIELSDMVARIVDYKSKFTMEHTRQIANKAWFMSGVYGYDETQRAKLYQAAALHDVGKLFIPTRILEKPDRLTINEFDIIKSHVLYTWEMLSPIRGFEQIAVWAADHHEKLDGSGYPFGKKADELDLNSRLLACLDIYQAVRETRPYHSGRTHEATMEILYNMAGKGLVDLEICRDLDRHLGSLLDGNAEGPQIRKRGVYEKN